MQPSRTHKVVLIIIFTGSLLLRFGLSLYNREANDHHMPVIRFIMRNNELPEKSDCSECFQPKLFHYTIAKILSVIGLVSGKDGDAQKVVAQMVNFLAGIITLIVALKLINRFPGIQPYMAHLAFALLAFNPQLIGINSQVTNDSFLILFSTLAIYFAYSFLHAANIGIFLLLTVFSTLAVATKTNSWVTVMAISLTLLIKIWVERPRLTRSFIYAILYIFSVSFLTILNPLTQYVYNFYRYGSPVLININIQAAPSFFKETYIPYAGIRSIRDGFFTFKFTELIKNPITELQDRVAGSSHRTSLWTRLYGSAHSIHFENYPPSWRGFDPKILMISRGIFILGLIPTLLIMVGAALEIFITIRGLILQNLPILQRASFGLFALIFFGYILFIALYAFQYRTYVVFKAIFIYPGLLAFVVLFLQALTTISNLSQKWHWIMTGIRISIFALVCLYISDVVSLVFHLLPKQL